MFQSLTGITGKQIQPDSKSIEPAFEVISFYIATLAHILYLVVATTVIILHLSPTFRLVQLNRKNRQLAWVRTACRLLVHELLPLHGLSHHPLPASLDLRGSDLLSTI